MDALGHDLLLLMLNLARVRDRGMIMRLFVEALSAALPGVTARYLEPGQETEGEVVDVATPEAHFGRVALEDPGGALGAIDRARYRNAVRMLAVVLENVARAERLASENGRLDSAVAARTGELRRSLAESEDLYQSASCGYHSLDGAGVYVRVNDTELRWLGYQREELVRKVKFQSLLAIESHQEFDRYFSVLKQQGTVKDIELQMIRKDGTPLPVLLSAAAVADGDGRFVMSNATVYDLSERRKAERDLRESEERFWQSQKLEAIGRLAGGIAHDFNNLLTVILACSELLEMSLGPEDPRRTDAGTIIDTAFRASSLTRQLLTFGRRQETNAVPMDLGSVVASMEKMLRRLIGEDVELEVSRGPDLGLIQADTAQMEQVVLNLVVNARDAMPSGGRVRVETSNWNRDPSDLQGHRSVVLTVSDTGTGIPPEARAHLFEPFFTTKPMGKGTGLGLATVYGIVKQAGGTIRVHSEVGQGTRFELLFPSIAGQRAETPPDRGEGLQGGTGTVLLVDDDPGVRGATVRVLREAGYTVIEAADGERAIKLAAELPRLDLLITDIVMPRMRGPQLAARLVRSRRDLKVIFMSGYPDGERLHMNDSTQASATFLQKPFSIGKLTRAVRERLGQPSDRKKRNAE